MRPVKTSLTHPLPLARVSTPDGGDVLFTMCPGKKQPNAATGPWDRDLETDLDALASAQTTTLLTLMEEHEIIACDLSLERISEACNARSIVWKHSPIVDFHPPSADWETAWLSLGYDLRERLMQGETIALHCRGGRGRAGMIAARLLVEFGISPDDAITLVRHQRPEAIETAPQEKYVRTISAVAPR